MPSIDPAYGEACTATMSPMLRKLVVDNTTVNKGVAASWNLGIDAAEQAGADWLVICSESMRFGRAGGEDFEARLGRGVTWGYCDRTCTEDGIGAGYCRDGYGWHLVGIEMAAIRRVGRFDERFYPAWWEDTDWTRRAELVGGVGGQKTYGIDAHLAAVEHTLAAGLVTGGWGDTMHVYVEKWGGQPGDEKWDRPYGRHPLTHVGPA